MTNLPAEHEGLLRVGPQASRHLDRPQEVEAGPTPGEAGRLVTNQVHLVLHTPSTSFVPRKQFRKKCLGMAFGFSKKRNPLSLD